MAERTGTSTPTWMVVGAFVILIPLMIWALNLFMGLVYATGIGLVVGIVGIVILFIWIKGRVDRGR